MELLNNLIPVKEHLFWLPPTASKAGGILLRVSLISMGLKGTFASLICRPHASGTAAKQLLGKPRRQRQLWVFRVLGAKLREEHKPTSAESPLPQPTSATWPVSDDPAVPSVTFQPKLL